MNHREQLGRLAFDEQLALEELQNLKREILRARSDRERAEAEFDAFLRGFHGDAGNQDAERRGAPPRPKPSAENPAPSPRVEQPQPARIEPPPEPPPATRIDQPEPPRVEQPQPPQPPAPPPRPSPEPPPKSEQPVLEAAPPLAPRALAPAPPLPPPPLEPIAAPPAAFDPQPAPPSFEPVAFDSAQRRPFDTAQGRPFDTDPEALPPPVVTDVPPLLVRPQRRQSVGAWIAIPIALIVLVAFVVMFRGDDADPQSEFTAAPAPAPPETPPADAPAQGAATSVPPQAPPEPGVNLEMVTTRPVWVRVTIDGRRAIERELAPGQRIPLRGERSILIRAGDAGAVTVTRDGRDLGQLGEDAMPATREFKSTAPPASRQ